MAPFTRKKSKKQQAGYALVNYLKLRTAGKAAKGAGKGAKKAAKGTAVVAVRWIVLPSGTKVLASGTPVRVRSGG